MKAKQNSKLSFFEAIYIWIYIYTTKSKFLTGRGDSEGAASLNLSFLQFLNLEFVIRSIIILFKLEISFSKWIDVGFLTCLTIINWYIYRRKLDSIVERHNALTIKERMANKLKMWIYIILTGLSIIGLFIAIELKRETPKTENRRDRLKIEIRDNHNSNITNKTFQLFDL